MDVAVELRRAFAGQLRVAPVFDAIGLAVERFKLLDAGKRGLPEVRWIVMSGGLLDTNFTENLGV